MKIKRIAHLGVAVKDLDEALKFFTQGLPLGDDSPTEDYQGMKIGFLPVGDSSIELLQDVSGSSAHTQVRGQEWRRDPPHCL